MFQRWLHELIITAFAVLLVAITLGMVLTVSANRIEPTKPAPLPVPTISLSRVELPNPAIELTTEIPLQIDVEPTMSLVDMPAETPTPPVSASHPKNPIQTSSEPKPQSVPLKTLPVKPVAVATVPATADVSFTNAFTERVFALTNEFRITQGLAPLKMSVALTKNATTYSASMLKNKRLNHTDILGCDLNCRFLRDGFTAQSWGENLAHYSFENKPTVEEVAQFFMREWQKSAGHRANLVSSVFTQTGIGISKNNTSIYVAVHFSRP